MFFPGEVVAPFLGGENAVDAFPKGGVDCDTGIGLCKSGTIGSLRTGPLGGVNIEGDAEKEGSNLLLPEGRGDGVFGIVLVWELARSLDS